MIHDVGVVIPVGPSDRAWVGLVDQLSKFQFSGPIVVVMCPKGVSLQRVDLGRWIESGGRYVVSRPGRARQLNSGLRFLETEYVWFLHADTRISNLSLGALENSLLKNKNRLHYFDLMFGYSASFLMKINEIGVFLRCRLFGIPFGDQGFCVSRDTALKLGGFCEDAPYGEDHLFVWKLREEGVRVSSVGSTIFTSPRKYVHHGWIRTTISHSYLTWAQAIPCFLSLLKKELKAS